MFLQAELSVDGELTFSYMNESVLSRLGREGRPRPSAVEAAANGIVDIRPPELLALVREVTAHPRDGDFDDLGITFRRVAGSMTAAADSGN